MATTKGALVGIGNDYQGAAETFKKFHEKAKTLDLPSLSVEEFDTLREDQFNFRVFGRRHTMRLVYGWADGPVPQSRCTVAVIECLQLDDSDDEYKHLSRCFLSSEDFVFVEGGRIHQPGIPGNAELVFCDLIAKSLPQGEKPPSDSYKRYAYKA